MADSSIYTQVTFKSGNERILRQALSQHSKQAMYKLLTPPPSHTVYTDILRTGHGHGPRSVQVKTQVSGQELHLTSNAGVLQCWILHAEVGTIE